MKNVPATSDVGKAASRPFDVIVVGAGPAGSLLAYQLAGAGVDVLLLDKAEFPRRKPCGCCLNQVALAALQTAGLPHLSAELNATTLDHITICGWGRRCTLRIPQSKSVSREVFDTALIAEAVAVGAEFLPGIEATLSSEVLNELRIVHVRRGNQHANLSCRIVAVADGLGGTSLRRCGEFGVCVRPQSRLGAATVIEESVNYRDLNRIYMNLHPAGYVGLVRLEDGRLDVAAAMEREFLRKCGNPGSAVARILEDVSQPVPKELIDGPWLGTPPLTRRRRRIAGERVFVLGDAASYVEPFTGEGIAWACLSAARLAPVIQNAVLGWSDESMVAWQRQHHQLRKKQTWCRLVAALWKRPNLAMSTLGALEKFPWLSRPFVSALNTAW